LIDYYTILQIPQNASQDDVKAAYYKLAMQYHPDRNPGNALAEEYFKRVNEAYGVIRDPVKRQWYNLMLQGDSFTQQIDPRKYGTRNRKDAGAYTQPVNEIKEEDDPRPLWMKLAIPSLAMIWGLLLIFNNWFLTSIGTEAAKVFFGVLLFLISAYFLVNNLYMNWLRIQGERTLSFNPENRSLLIYIALLFLTLPSFWALGIARKAYHLSHYGIVTEAKITDMKSHGLNYHLELVYYTQQAKPFSKDLDFNSPLELHDGNLRVFVKYSAKEPRITQYHIKLTGLDSLIQPYMDDLEKDYDYFSMQ
jgi:hypothetical protein